MVTAAEIGSDFCIEWLDAVAPEPPRVRIHVLMPGKPVVANTVELTLYEFDAVRAAMRFSEEEMALAHHGGTW